MAAPMDAISCAHENALPPASVLKKAITSQLNVPIVFKKQANAFCAIPWSAADLIDKYGQTNLDFRLVSKTHEGISWEGKGKVVEATINNFTSWQTETTDILDDSNPFKIFNKDDFWAYSSYNYMNMIFHSGSDIVKGTNWSQFGFPEITGLNSTFWLGSEGAYTPCHFDTYGCNLVLQMIGRKKWILFPPTDTTIMYPTRIPYEESSVFSSVNILDPDLSLHPLFEGCHPHVVELEPGDVLFVPHKWWHFVSCLDCITSSINAWIPLDADSECRLEESVTKVLMSSFISFFEPEGDNWLNPNEEQVLPEENLQYISSSLIELKSRKNEHIVLKNYVKVPKISKETDVGFQRCKDDINIFDYEGITEVKSLLFDNYFIKTNESVLATTPSPSKLTLNKIVDCFVHPEVINLISQLLQKT